MAFVASSMQAARLLVLAAGCGAGHAVAEVLVEQADGDALQRLRRRRDLGEDVDAVLVVARPSAAARGPDPRCGAAA